jgi:hypothetical protein
MVFPLVLGALLVWAGVGAVAGVAPQTGLAVALCIVGVGFVCGAFVGGSKALIVPAVVVGAALVATSLVDVPLSGPIGERTWVPRSTAELERYELSIGEGVLDLTELPLPADEPVSVAASIGLGHLVVLVPDGAALDIRARASAGDAELFGRSDSGVDVDVSRSYEGERGMGALSLDLEVGLGQVEVRAARAERPTTGASTTSTPR